MAISPTTNRKTSIATTLLKKVFFVYILFAAVITASHIYLEYNRVKDDVIGELNTLYTTLAKPLGIALWDADEEQLGSLMEGLLASNHVFGVSVSETEGGNIKIVGTIVNHIDSRTVVDRYGLRLDGEGTQKDIFGYKYPIKHSDSAVPHNLGYVSIFTSQSVILNSIKYQLFYIILTASVKACVLWFGFFWYGKKLLTRPLSILSERAVEVSTDNLHPIEISLAKNEKNEITVLLEAFNSMVENLNQGVLVQKQLYAELDSYKDNLEELVEDRTAELQKINEKLNEQILERIEAENEASVYGRILEKSLNEIYVFDSETLSFLVVNEGARANLGYTGEELNDLNLFDILPEIIRSSTQEKLLPLKEGNGEQLVFQSIHQRKDLSTYDVETHLQCMDFPERTVFVAIVLDISEKIILEEQLRQSQKMEAIGTLAGGIAHDFNNLMMGVQGRASLIAADEKLPDQTYAHIGEIEKYVDKAKGLTQQLLGIARGGKYNPHPTNLYDLVKESAAMFGRTRKDICMTNVSQKEDVVVDIDSQQIEHVLLNMFLNGWQALSSGGEIQFGTDMVHFDQSETQTYDLPAGQYGTVVITDNGFGMDESVLSQIFNPFFTTKDKGRGTGLGLASAYGIIKNHSGFIVAESEVGVGSIFTIYLPISDKSVSSEVSPEVDLEQGEGTVLLIDDEQMILDVAGEMLKGLGYEVILAQGGEKALETLKLMDGKVDLVILDLIMPGLDGSETFDLIRELYPLKPILISSGYAIDGQAKELLRKGRCSFIQKPYGMSEISSVVKGVISTYPS